MGLAAFACAVVAGLVTVVAVGTTGVTFCTCPEESVTGFGTGVVTALFDRLLSNDGLVSFVSELLHEKRKLPMIVEKDTFYNRFYFNFLSEFCTI